MAENSESQYSPLQKIILMGGGVLILILVFVLCVEIVSYYRYEDAVRIQNAKIDTTNSCAARAYLQYVDNWNSECSRLGYDDYCTLTNVSATRVDDAYQKQLDRCYEF